MILDQVRKIFTSRQDGYGRRYQAAPRFEYGAELSDTGEGLRLNSQRREDGAAQDESQESEGQQRSTAFKINPRVISDATIGLADGLTVPFALTAGLSALGSSKVVIFGGFAELIAGAISMGLGGYLGARGECEAFTALVSSTRALVQRDPDYAIKTLRESLAPLSMDGMNIIIKDAGQSLDKVTASSSLYKISSSHTTEPMDEERLTRLLLRYVHLQPCAPPTHRAYLSGLTIGLAYLGGGFIPMVPYFFSAEVGDAFWWSVAVMGVALAAFGAGKTFLISGGDGAEKGDGATVEREGDSLSMTGILKRRRKRRLSLAWQCAQGAVTMMLLGGVAAGAATGLVVAFNQGHGLSQQE